MSEFFINMKDIPPKGSRDYDAFYALETEKIKYGLTINGVYFHGWLYWHLNHWKTNIDSIDPRDNSIIRNFTNPHLRDNEWLIAEKLMEAEKDKKGLCIVGARRLAKSVFMSSYIARSATIYKGSENVIVGNNKDDLAVLTSLCDKGLNALPDYYKFGRVLDDWRREVILGFKSRAGDRNTWSTIFIRNTDSGSHTEVVAGTTPKALVMDEIGKHSFLEVFDAAKPSFESPFGWRAVPILVGTGGDFSNGHDAQLMFNDPDTYNMVSMILPEEGGKKTCIFIPGTYSLEFPKNPAKMSTFAGVSSGSELDDITIYVSDHEAAKKTILDKRQALHKAKDAKALLKYKMYFPLTSDECFLTESDNNFPIEEARIAHELIMQKPELQGEAVRLVRDASGKVRAEPELKKKIIWEFPHGKNTDTDAPVVIYEPPMKNAPLFLYIAGIDPYNQNTSQSSDSLGVCFIHKRMYDLVSGTFQNRIVASYAARPKTMKEWNETVEMLLEYYNATAMMENEGTSLLQHLDSKNKGHLLADGFTLLTEISPNTSIRNRPKGLPATVPVIRHCMNIFIEYTKEECILGYDNDSNAIAALGVARIPDPMLLKEIISYRSGMNVDRICAYRHALAYDKYLEKNYPLIDVPLTEHKEPLKVNVRTPFPNAGNPFGSRRPIFK